MSPCCDRNQGDVQVLLAAQENVLLHDDIEVFADFDGSLQALQLTLHLQNQRGSSQLRALQVANFFSVAEQKLSDRTQADLVVGGSCLNFVSFGSIQYSSIGRTRT